MKIALFVLPVLFAATAIASTPASVTPASVTDATAMRKADFLVGHWQGSGWIVSGSDHVRHTFTESETLTLKQGGSLLLIEGEGHNAKGKVVHDALAVMTWDAQAQHYRWQAWSDGAPYIDASASIGDKTLVWGFQEPHAGTLRFTIKLDAQGRWVETGEMSPDGKRWFPFFGMTLTRKQ